MRVHHSRNNHTGSRSGPSVGDCARQRDIRDDAVTFTEEECSSAVLPRLSCKNATVHSYRAVSPSKLCGKEANDTRGTFGHAKLSRKKMNLYNEPVHVITFTTVTIPVRIEVTKGKGNLLSTKRVASESTVYSYSAVRW